MSTNPTLAAELRELYAKESARLKEKFAATSDGRALLAAQNASWSIPSHDALWREIISARSGRRRRISPSSRSVATGENALFPYSDIDLLFLHAAGQDRSENQGTVFADSRRSFGTCA